MSDSETRLSMHGVYLRDASVRTLAVLCDDANRNGLHQSTIEQRVITGGSDWTIEALEELSKMQLIEQSTIVSSIGQVIKQTHTWKLTAKGVDVAERASKHVAKIKENADEIAEIVATPKKRRAKKEDAASEAVTNGNGTA